MADIPQAKGTQTSHLTGRANILSKINFVNYTKSKSTFEQRILRGSMLLGIISFVSAVVFLLTGCSTYQVTKPDYLAYLDTVKAGQVDTGKMWTFDNPPIDYFKKNI